MVAVKSLWGFWKNFSTSLSFSSISSTLSSGRNSSRSNDTNDNQKQIKYNRLKGFKKSISSHFPAVKNSSSTSSFNCMKKSKSSSCDTNRNRNPASRIGWDDSDTEFEDDNNEFVKELDAYHMRMTMEEISDLDDEDEALTCDVCDRSFPTAKRLANHQFKKRHYGCLQCDSIFPTRQALDHHREQMDHYDFVSQYGSDTTSFDSDDENGLLEDEDEEREQLL